MPNAQRLSALLVFCLSFFGPAHAVPAHPVPSGTFIQWHLIKDWSDRKWQSEFSYLRRAGMHRIMFAPCLDGKSREVFYTSSIAGTKAPAGDLVERLLRNAKRANFEVFLGLNMHEDWWRKGVQDKPWFMGQVGEGNQVADELYSRYKKHYPKTFIGWYWVWEVANVGFPTAVERQTLVEALDTNVRHLKSLDPTMPVMLCPFMNEKLGTAKDYGEFWADVLANSSLGKGDIFAPQDCVGAGGLRPESVTTWFRELRTAVKAKPGLLFWSDAETFDQTDWSSAPLNRFVSQLRDVEPFVDEIITFAYSHYYSPNGANPAWQKGYERYVRTGVLDKTPPPAPFAVRIDRATAKPTVHWHAIRGANGDSGFEVLSDGKVIGKVQIPKSRRKPHEELKLEIDAPPAGVVTVRSFDVYGNVSKEIPAR